MFLNRKCKARFQFAGFEDKTGRKKKQTKNQRGSLENAIITQNIGGFISKHGYSWIKINSVDFLKAM